MCCEHVSSFDRLLSVEGIVPMGSKPREYFRSGVRLVLGLLLISGVGGCSTYRKQNKIIGYWKAGDLVAAEKEANKLAEKKDEGRDEVIWRLEQGTVLRSTGNYQESNLAFSEAEERMDKYAAEAKVRIGNEAGALLSNQANLPYEGRFYDRIMLNTYKALNFLQLDHPEGARVELIRAYFRQQDAVEANRKRIADAQEEVEQSDNRRAIQQAENSPSVQAGLEDVYSNLKGFEAYADYVNPFTVFLDGLFFSVRATDLSDLERANKSLERLKAFMPHSAYLAADLAAVQERFKGESLTSTTYVVFETGCAPMRDQTRIDIPILVADLSYVGAAFPKLEFQSDYVKHLVVLANGIPLTTDTIASMDSVIGLAFKNELPTVITKTIASTVTKALASYAINSAARQGGSGDYAGLAARLITALYQAAVNIADLRTWTTLPKEFQYCRFATPESRRIELQTPDGRQRVSVVIEDGFINLVYAKSISSGAPLLISQTKLK